ncbi:hypothetical protein Tco_0678185, partial [Tanacetum coccineum]
VNRALLTLQLLTLKEVLVAAGASSDTPFGSRRDKGREVRGGGETQQLTQLQSLVETVILSNADDRWIWDLNGEGTFCVKDARNLIDEVFLPKAPAATRWLKLVPIKVNIFVWKLQCDRLPLGIIWSEEVCMFRMSVVLFVRRGLKMWLICFFFVRLLEMLVALFVDGGIFPGCKLVPLRNGLIGSLRFVWVPD